MESTEGYMMKLKRLLALGLSLALTLSLAAVPAHAAAFADIENHWAYTYIEDMAARGYASGDGVNFHPDSTMSATEALLFCARLTGVDPETQDHIAADRWEEVAVLLPSNYVSWAAREMAVAVETGVISLAELEALGQTAPSSVTSSRGPQPYLLWNVSRENVCMYLARAMQLEPLVRSMDPTVYTPYLSSYYADVDNITPSLRPYIYVLTIYGIFNGMVNASDGLRYADPKGNLTRAQMMTLMSKALEVIDARGIHTELSEYTDYAWAAGKIIGATAGLDGGVILTLQSDISGVKSYDLPNGVKIYEDNMLADSSFLRNGKYVRLNLSEEGKVESARLGGSLTVYQGTVSDLNGGQLTLLVDETSKSFTIDRFTEVMAGSAVGDRTVIDYEAGYADAVCYVDALGHLAGVKLTGGTVQRSGLIQNVNVNALTGIITLGVASFDGVVSSYAIPAGTAVTVNGALGQLASSHVGRHVILRVNEDGNQVTAVSVNTLTAFVQGRLVRQGTVGGDRNVTIANVLDSDREITCLVNANAMITYMGEERTAAQMETGWFVTARLVGGDIVEMEAFSATASLEGVLTSITRGSTTVLEVELPDGGTVIYNLELGALPTITRDGKNSGVDTLRTGDKLVITLRYNKVSQIDATPVEANLKGQISGIADSLTSRSIEVTLEDGTVMTYAVGEGVSVTKGGRPASFRDLNPGDAVALLTNGAEVISIDITAVASTEGMLTGVVYTITAVGNTRSLSLLVEGRRDPVVVDLRTSSAVILDRNGKSLTLNYGLVPGDTVVVYGSYDGSTFVATMVTKL